MDANMTVKSILNVIDDTTDEDKVFLISMKVSKS